MLSEHPCMLLTGAGIDLENTYYNPRSPFNEHACGGDKLTIRTAGLKNPVRKTSANSPRLRPNNAKTRSAANTGGNGVSQDNVAPKCGNLRVALIILTMLSAICKYSTIAQLQFGGHMRPSSTECPAIRTSVSISLGGVEKSHSAHMITLPAWPWRDGEDVDDYVE